jgi:hypothetical protein
VNEVHRPSERRKGGEGRIPAQGADRREPAEEDAR